MSGPLASLKVLDFSTLLPGPFATLMLADMGAEVLRVESPTRPDMVRLLPPSEDGVSAVHGYINRSKRSIAVDLKKPEGKEIIRRLVAEYDIIVEQFRPGVMDRLGVGYEDLKAINPGLIYCSISGYGQTGPSRHKGGFDLVAQGMSGLMSMTGEPGRRPLKTGVAVYDIGAGLTAIYSILAAYIHRQRSGEGQHLDIAIAECGLPWFTWEAGAYFSEGRVPEATGWRHRVSAPYQAMRVRDGYMMLGCANQRTWERFCEDVIERPELMVDERFKTNLDRGANVEALEAILEDILGQQDRAYWLDRCDAAGVPAGPINDFDQAMHDEHYLAREMVLEVDHPTMGRMKTLGFPSKFSATPLAIRQPAPLFAQHTDEVLGEIGLAADEIDALRQQGAVR